MRVIAIKKGFRQNPLRILSLLSIRRQLNSLKICSQTKVLNTTVCIASALQEVNIFEPAKLSTKVITSCTMACPIIIFHMLNEMIDAFFGSGFLSRSSGVGGSVAKANAAKVSMIKLTQRSWTAVRADCSELLAIEDTKANTTAVTLTVNWN